jgi:signal transduction histidine kinase
VSGERLRARERYAQLRFLLGLGGVTAIILVFGGIAIRQQRRKLQVARALEIAGFEREREKLLAKADKMATLAVLGSGIAHEVATPLSTIMARVEQVLPSTQSDPRASAALHVVLEQVQRIQTIIRGVLGLARGELPPLVPARPETIASNAAALSRHRFGQAGVELALDVPSDLPDLACDPPLLEQALTNLLINACDASKRGGTVHFSAHVDGALLCFCVIDDGEGISAEAAARAKEPFFTTKPKGLGNGLGLAITREVVAHHGGELKLEPRSSARGTRAIIALPHV